MGKRQVRILYPELATKLPGLLHQVVQIILWSGVVIHGNLVAIQPINLIIQDKKKQKHTLAILQIQEIVLDYETIKL